MITSGTRTRVGKVTYQHSRELVDHETGAIEKETKEQVVRVDAEPPYIKMYIDDLCAVVNAPNSLKDVLLLALRKLDYDGYLSLSTRYRKQICTQLDITDGTLRNRVSALVKRGFLHSEGGANTA